MYTCGGGGVLSDGVAEEPQDPPGEVTWGEDVVGVVIHCEVPANLRRDWGKAFATNCLHAVDLHTLNIETHTQTDRWAGRQTDRRQADRRAGRQTDRQTGRQTDRQKERL